MQEVQLINTRLSLCTAISKASCAIEQEFKHFFLLLPVLEKQLRQ